MKLMSNSNLNSETLAELSNFYQDNPDITLEGKSDDNNKMRRFFFKVAVGGLNGNDLEFELSEDGKLNNRERTVSELLKRNSDLFQYARTQKLAKNMVSEAYRFFMERGNVIAAFDVKQKQTNFVYALFSILFVPKVLATALFGVFAVFSSGELINLASILSSGGQSTMFFICGMPILFVLYFGIIDLRYLRPKLSVKSAVLRGVYPAILLTIYTFIILFSSVQLFGLDYFLLVEFSVDDADFFCHLLVLTFISGMFSLLLQSLWDKEAILRPI